MRKPIPASFLMAIPVSARFQHLAGELFKSLAATPDIVQVPYRGTGPLITDLISGQVPMGTPGVTGQLIEFHRSGKMRVLAVTSPARLNAALELPTTSEQGFQGVTVMGSIGLLAPAGTAIEIIERIAQATRTIVAEPAFKQMLIEAGIEPTFELEPHEIPRIPRSRCCSLDFGRQNARVEDRLIVGEGTGANPILSDVRVGSFASVRVCPLTVA